MNVALFLVRHAQRYFLSWLFVILKPTKRVLVRGLELFDEYMFLL